MEKSKHNPKWKSKKEKITRIYRKDGYILVKVEERGLRLKRSKRKRRKRKKG